MAIISNNIWSCVFALVFCSQIIPSQVKFPLGLQRVCRLSSNIPSHSYPDHTNGETIKWVTIRQIAKSVQLATIGLLAVNSAKHMITAVR